MVDERMFGVPFALTCDSCGEPLLPNLSQADADGCPWICLNPDCPELCAGELEAEDLVEGGGAPPWPPSASSPPRRPSAAPPATPPPTPRSASPASTLRCRGCPHRLPTTSEL